MNTDPGVSAAADTGRPVLRIVRGEPTPEELATVAALVTAAVTAGVTAAATSGPSDPPAPRRGRWNDPAHGHARMPAPGPGAWAASCR